MQPVPLKYLRGYPEPLQAQVRQLLADGGVSPLLRRILLVNALPLSACGCRTSHRLLRR